MLDRPNGTALVALPSPADRPRRGDRGIALRVLGELAVDGACGTFAPGRTRPGAVLALLAIHAGDCVPADRLIDELWTAQSPGRGVKRVQVNVLRLRRGIAAVAPRIDPAALVRTRSHGYALEIDPERIDAVRFARLVGQGHAQLACGNAAPAAATLRDALELWGGDPYAGYAYESFAAGEIRRLEDLRAVALEDSAEAELALGGHATVSVELRRVIARHPLRERLHALLMVALYRAGRQGEALAAYHEARRVLVGDLGIEPGSELRELQRAILEQSPALDLAASESWLRTPRRTLAQVA
jgi:DNA-binding SARP family transcriptional activator